MTAPILPLLAQTAPSFDPVLLVLMVGILGLFAVVLVPIVAWAKVSRQAIALKQQMVERGMTADEILAVLTGTKPQEEPREGAVNLPCASEVVVDIDGEWQTGLILKQEGDQYYVHVVGTEMSDNQWVSRDRMRFPASNDGGDRAGDWSFPSEFSRTARGCDNGVKAKPAGVDREI